MKGIRFLLLCVLLALAEAGCFWFVLENFTIPVPTLWLETLTLFVLLTWLLNAFLPISLPPVIFGSRYLFTLVTRFMVTVAYMIISGILLPQDILPNTLFILSNYVLFLVLEVIYLFKNLNGSKKTLKPPKKTKYSLFRVSF